MVKNKSHKRSMPSGRLSSLVRKNKLLTALMLFSVVIFHLTFSVEVVSPDGSSYLLLGKQLLQGRYDGTFFHRMPFLPAVVAALYALGLGVAGVTYAVPLAFIFMALVSTYLLARELTDEKIAKLTTLLLFCFPEFWRWGVKLLADIPLLVFSNMTLYFFMKARSERRYFLHAGLFMGLGMVTKLTSFILPAALLIYLLLMDRESFRSRELWIGAAISLLMLSSAFAAFSLISQGDQLSQVSKVLVIGERIPTFKQLLTGQYYDVQYVLKLLLFPLIVFAPFGIAGLWKRKSVISLLYPLVFVAFFFFLWGIRLRYFSALFPFLVLFSAVGFIYVTRLLKGEKLRLMMKLVFVCLLVVSFMDSLYLLSLDSRMLWGVEKLSQRTARLDGLVLSEYMPNYLNVTGDVVTDRAFIIEYFGDPSRELLESRGVRYVVLSIYEEWSRMPDESAYFHPELGPFEITFVRRPYSNGRVPDGYEFGSDVYEKLESSLDYSKVEEVTDPGGRKIFVIYEVANNL